MAKILADSLADLPEIESVDISDNSLTDLSLVPCVDALSKIKNLTELDLSSNSMGPKAAKAISDYLSSSQCPLKKLTIQNSDVNDYQCEKFITALQNNSTLLYLDLSNNKIGNAETLNAVKPDLITGGEAIAALLRCSKTELKVLKLGWNYIRLHSAVDLASSLNYNRTLQYLDLSSNSLGRDGGDTLGKGYFLFFKYF